MEKIAELPINKAFLFVTEVCLKMVRLLCLLLPGACFCSYVSVRKKRKKKKKAQVLFFFFNFFEIWSVLTSAGRKEKKDR